MDVHHMQASPLPASHQLKTSNESSPRSQPRASAPQFANASEMNEYIGRFAGLPMDETLAGSPSIMVHAFLLAAILFPLASLWRLPLSVNFAALTGGLTWLAVSCRISTTAYATPKLMILSGASSE
jgi:hypothetical protein